MDIPSLDEMSKYAKGKEASTPKLPSSNVPSLDEMAQFAKGEPLSPIALPTGGSSQKPAQPNSWLERVLEGLDYAGNISRSGIKGATEGGVEKALEFAKEAAKKERYTDPSELRKKIFSDVGKADGEFDWGDAVDFAGDVAVDMATDPLSLLSFGIGRVGKTGTQLGKAIQASKFGKVNKYTKAKDLAQPALGGLYGAGMSDPDASAMDVLENAAIGAGTVIGAKQVGLPLAKKAIYGGKAESTLLNLFPDSPKEAQGLFDYLSNQHNKFMGPKEKKTVFRYIPDPDNPKMVHSVPSLEKAPISKDIAEDFEIGLGTHPKRKKFQDRIIQNSLTAFEDLDVNDAHSMINELADLKDLNVASRQSKLKKQLKMARKFGKNVDEGSPEYKRAFRKATEDANFEASQAFEKRAQQLEAEGKPMVARAMRTFKTSNEQNRDFYQSVLREQGLEDMEPGLEVWVPDVRPPRIKDEIAKAKFPDKDSPEFIRSRKATGAEGDNFPLGFDPSKTPEENVKNFKAALDIKAQRDSFKMLSKIERDALARLNERRDARGAILTMFDGVTGFVKSNLLYSNISWLKNNFHDNILKSMVENGIFPTLKANTWDMWQKNLRRDLSAVVTGKVEKKYVTEMLKDAIEYEVLDGTALKALDDKYLADIMASPLEKAKLADRHKDKMAKLIDSIDNASEKYQGFLRKTVGNVGGYHETAMRLLTFKNNYKMLTTTPYFKDLAKEMGEEAAQAEAKKIAAKITQDAFFNYASVTHFENAVLKRALPFYAFYSKNLPYWVKSGFDIEKAGKIANIDKLRKNVGEPVTPEEHEGLTQFLATNAPRKIKGGMSGDLKVMTAPAFSMFDAIKMTNPSQDLGEEVIQKGNPILKTGYELLANRDLFMDGRELRPSKSKGGEKYLFSRGGIYKFIQDAIDSTLGIEGSLGVSTNEKGKVKTSSDNLVRFDKVAQLAFPFAGSIQKAYGTYDKNVKGSETPGESAFNILGPSQTTNVFPEVFWQTKNHKEAQRLKALAKEDEERKKQEAIEFVRRLTKDQ